MKGTSGSPLTEEQGRLLLYGPGVEAKCLQFNCTKIADNDYKFVFVFSKMALLDTEAGSN
jgi:hypothetical protein